VTEVVPALIVCCNCNPKGAIEEVNPLGVTVLVDGIHELTCEPTSPRLNPSAIMRLGLHSLKCLQRLLLRRRHRQLMPNLMGQGLAQELQESDLS